jgi:Ca2+-dependent lipid-binding protein
MPIKVRAYIYQCKDLPAADSNGTSDPFIKVWDISDKYKKT